MSSDRSIFSLCQFSFFKCMDEEVQSSHYQVKYYKPSHRLTKWNKNSNSPKKLSTINSLNFRKAQISQDARRHTFGVFTNNRISLRQKKRFHTEKIATNIETQKNCQQKNTNYASTIQSRTFHSNAVPHYYQPVTTIQYAHLNSPFVPHRISQTAEIYYKPKLSRLKSFHKNPQAPSLKEIKLQKIQSINSQTYKSQKKIKEQIHQSLLQVPQQKRKRKNSALSQISKSIDDLDIRQTISQKDSNSQADKMSQIHQQDLAEFNKLFSLKRIQLQEQGKNSQSFSQKDSIDNVLPMLSKKKISLKRKDTIAL